MRRWATLADDQLAQHSYLEKWERRHLHASTTLDGWLAGDFFLDPITGATLLNVLDHLAPPDPEDAPDGTRTLSQRRADALADLAGRAAADGTPSGMPVNVNTVIDIATLVGETPPAMAARCDVEGVGPVTRSVLDQLCCDARFTRFIMAGPSVPWTRDAPPGWLPPANAEPSTSGINTAASPRVAANHSGVTFITSPAGLNRWGKPTSTTSSSSAASTTP